jgi:hypothetical protein
MPSSLPPTPPTPPSISSIQYADGPRSHWLLAGVMAAVAFLASLVTACKSPPEPLPELPQAESQGLGAVVSAASAATTPLEYRKDAAAHLYRLNTKRIYQGKLPTALYAIGVLQVDVDRSGRVTRLHWMRAPQHAPEVVIEIERTVRAAAPFPVPTRLGSVTYTDTWLWDKQGQFQLDTLTEGQL